MTDKIRKELFSLQDLKYREMQEKIIPTVKPESIIGVRTPELRRMAKELAGREGIDAFLNDLPHRYFDENQLHAFILSGMKDYAECLAALERFLPYVDNWWLRWNVSCRRWTTGPPATRCRRRCSGSTGRNFWNRSENGLRRMKPTQSGSGSAC